MGCHRSGTNLLYDTLLSAGGFAVYRGYLPVHKLLIPRFGNLAKRKNRETLLQFWLKTESFRRSGLAEDYLREQVLDHCRNGGDFIRITMDAVARQQQVERWAVYDPDALLYISQIKSEIPDALFVHIIRDGRDVALSLQKMGGFRPFPWNRVQLGLEQTAVYWGWMVNQGRQKGSEIPSDYMEVHYEELVSNASLTLQNLSHFTEHDLNYERIQQTALGRIRDSNSSFLDQASSTPINRWKEKLTLDKIASLEAAVGHTLQGFGYELSSDPAPKGLNDRWLRFFYPALLNTKVFLKTKTPLGRFSNLEPLRASVIE
jgi:hypothetical protein